MIRSRAALFATSLALALAGCAGTTFEAPPQAASPASRITGMDNPTTPDDLPQGSSILEVERYRPSYRLEGCAGAPLPSAAPGAGLAAAIAEAQAYSDAQRGLGLIVLHKGAIVHQSFAPGLTQETPSASASMMKSVIALLYGIALEEGMIGSIDDPVGEYLAEWQGDPRGTITLRQLLTMSAGLGQSNFMEILLSPDIGKAALAIEQVSEPDTEFSYNNAITKLLTLVLDRRLAASGKGSVLTFLEEELWCPLGNGDAQVWIDQQGAARGYAGLHAGLIDYARIGELIRKRGAAGGEQVVPESWIAQMAQPSAVNPQYGLHVWLGRAHTPQRAYSASNPIKVPHSQAFAAEDIVYFDGFGGQRVYVVPSRELVIARMGEVNLQYDDAIIPNLLIRAPD
ncbi:MAG: serine hydrolase [Erythrobacter sp.]|jgi:CubicO group peptidase (beta-lactamase class C family)|nr:serine hydrolase [Erythrobacter sp.]